MKREGLVGKKWNKEGLLVDQFWVFGPIFLFWKMLCRQQIGIVRGILRDFRFLRPCSSSESGAGSGAGDSKAPKPKPWTAAIKSDESEKNDVDVSLPRPKKRIDVLTALRQTSALKETSAPTALKETSAKSGGGKISPRDPSGWNPSEFLCKFKISTQINEIFPIFFSNFI